MTELNALPINVMIACAAAGFIFALVMSIVLSARLRESCVAILVLSGLGALTGAIPPEFGTYAGLGCIFIIYGGFALAAMKST